jgi:hypothetical protein
MDPIEVLVQTLVQGYAVIVAFMVGWALPRGNNLRMMQLWILRKVHNFLAWEDERVVDRINKTKTAIKNTSKRSREL